ncbi:hypothetical protein ACFSMZ_02865, partial [Chelativorans composti]
DDLVGLVSLVCHCGPPSGSKPYFKVDPFNGGGSLAPASDLAPFAYSGLVWSMAVTWLVWGTIPEIWTFLGAGVIFSSSFFYFVSSKKKREQKV